MSRRIPLVAVSLTLFVACSSTSELPSTPLEESALEFSVDLTDRSDDLFHVTLAVSDLGTENSVFQFASTAPGTYQVMDIGRFVRSFAAYDAAGVEIPVEHVAVNQWRISEPTRVSTIVYSVAETWDTPVDVHPVYMMAGTSIEDDHALVNGQAVFGYLSGMQDRDLKIRFVRPESWTVGTALPMDPDGAYRASSFDHVVDSPVLMGRLSHAEVDVRGCQVEVYTYSKTDKVHSSQIVDAVRDILFATDDFLGGLPVERYAFLFHFEDVSMGAWEHSYSSTYVYREDDFDQAIKQSIRDVAAHEFFHIVTPLNIHSEIIERFNFSEPVASQHLWLYEGTTEWASDALQLRAGLIDLESYLNRQREKLTVDDHYDKDYSLRQLSLTSYSDKGQQEYPNVYMRGAVVSGLLDLRLLELSGGTSGLRELLIDLSERFGPDRPFPENSFVDTLVALTYPQIRDFFDRYIHDAQTLPIAEFYSKVGIDYAPERATGEMVATAGIQINFVESRFVVSQVAPKVAECGLAVGDVLVGFNGQEVNMSTIQTVGAAFNQLAAGVPYEMTVLRENDSLTMTCAKFETEKIDRHVFTVRADASPDQIRLRNALTTNSPLRGDSAAGGGS